MSIFVQTYNQMTLNVHSETSRLREVVLGLPDSMGPVPQLRETFDAKSYESVLKGIYPKQEDVKKEMDAFEAILLKYGVKVYRPEPVPGCNQVFARDVGFVIDDKIIVSNIIPDRQDEIDAYDKIYSQIHYKQIYNLPETVHVEGGDVVLYNGVIFLGQYVNLRKSDTNPYEGILHLDCTFMPVGRDKAIIYRDGFLNPRDADHLVDLFGKDNVFEITKEEMYWMNSNIFSISEEVVVIEENFVRLGEHLRNKWGMTVETVPYREISKMGGLLRCSTLPLRRD